MAAETLDGLSGRWGILFLILIIITQTFNHDNSPHTTAASPSIITFDYTHLNWEIGGDRWRRGGSDQTLQRRRSRHWRPLRNGKSHAIRQPCGHPEANSRRSVSGEMFLPTYPVTAKLRHHDSLLIDRLIQMIVDVGSFIESSSSGCSHQGIERLIQRCHKMCCKTEDNLYLLSVTFNCTSVFEAEIISLKNSQTRGVTLKTGSSGLKWIHFHFLNVCTNEDNKLSW